MIVSRLVSLVLRIAQFVFAAIVLGLTAYFLYQRSRNNDGPFGRVVFAVIWSSLSIIGAIIWAVPTSSSMTGYVSDLGTSLQPNEIIYTRF
jgi:heme/copper-type cytochrome/quinol oxidase subunit 2